MPYINLSGKGNQQYGFYDECLRDGNHYSTTIIQPNTGGTLYYGICHSKECESNDLMSKTAQTLIKTILDSTGIPKALGVIYIIILKRLMFSNLISVSLTHRLTIQN